MQYPASKQQQGGFTLVELAVVIVLLISMASLGGIFSFTGDKSKASNLLQSGRLYGDAIMRYKNDTGVTPKHMKSLFLKASNTAADTNEATDASTTWRGPYVNGFKQDANGDVAADFLSSGSVITVTLPATANLPTGMNTGLQFTFSNLPDTVIKEAVANCNSTDVAATLPTTYTAGNKCIGKLAAAGVAGNVQMLFYMAP